MPVNIDGTGGVTTPGLASTAMPTSGGDPIVASGSNTDGEWVRWADGEQKITAQHTIGVNTTRAVTYPVAFTRVDSITTQGYGTASWPEKITIDGNTRIVSPSLTDTVVRNNSSDIGNDFFLTATGRWK